MRRPHLHPASVAQFAAFDRAAATPRAEFTVFMTLSVELTGFSEAELAFTGLTRVYFEELGLVLGKPARTLFLTPNPAWTAHPEQRLADPLHGPVARNLIRLWYLGRWDGLDARWQKQLQSAVAADDFKAFDEFGRNLDRVVSPRTYQEGLAWRAIGTNPPGAKQPGWASWARKP